MRTEPRIFFAIIFVTLFSPVLSVAFPAQIILIRHAEKPDSGPELSERGHQRAEALVNYFIENPELTVYGTPAAIFATDPAKPGGSLRSIETVTPLADAIHVPIQHDLTRSQTRKLADRILNTPEHNGKMVLVCWEHKELTNIVKAIGMDPLPLPWGDAVFDRTWILDLNTTGEIKSFRDLPQNLLPGDSQESGQLRR